ncbi:CvpA family protein [Alkalibacter saccharofermentans]|uniref:Colicin V production protein n=1 Tax=Alkalibacter saccharofermentans DSM 14828 TaxID=1120975 RepID=A0A1M4T4W3_9FIRM|nr:CvpA family protein [Alkalibacter saccharofermentans]SHE39573.1 Colicin V production protein [Alkalibacter saccharofermentans DSM 14828]
MSWIDILIIGVFVLYVIADFKRGLVNALASILSFVISLIIASSLYKSVYELVTENTDIYSNLYNFIAENFRVGNSSEAKGLEQLDLNKLPVGARDFIQNAAAESGNMNIAFDFAATLADMILYLLCFIGVFLIVRLIIFVIAGFFDFIAKLPVLNIMNKTGGAFMGIIEGAIVNIIIINSIYSLAILFNHSNIINALNNSYIAQYFYIGYLFF